jgi:hypothetical protein
MVSRDAVNDPDARTSRVHSGSSPVGPRASAVDGRFELPLAGQTVLQVWFDFAVTLLFENDVTIRIEQPFVLEPRDGSQQVVEVGQEGASVCRALDVLHLQVSEGWAYEDGRLEVNYTNGLRLTVPAYYDYEPWQLNGPGSLLIVSTPNGKLGIWSDIPTES